jgi:hypothetical protein
VAPTDVQRDLQQLETELRRLEAEYNMFFAGRLPRPPWETRSRVEAVVKRFDRAYIANYGDRFRFTTIQSRFAALVELWDRGLRARDEVGRPGSVGRARPGRDHDGPPIDDRIVHVASFSDPSGESQKLRELYNSLAAARREVGDEPVPFQRFADLVSNHVTRMKAEGSGEVAFRVAVKDGKVSLTARGLKGLTSDEEN